VCPSCHRPLTSARRPPNFREPSSRDELGQRLRVPAGPRVSRTGAFCVGFAVCEEYRNGVSDVRRPVRASRRHLRPAAPPRRAERGRRERGPARDPRGAARGRRRPSCRQAVRLRRARARRGPGGPALRHAWPAGGQDRPRPSRGHARGRERGAEPQRLAAGAGPDGRPAGIGQDHLDGEDRAAAEDQGPQEGPDGLARHAPSGGAGAVAHPRRAGGRGHAADRPRAAAGRDRAARDAGRAHRGLRRGDAGYRRPPRHRRGADGRGRGGA
jgi:hypothetical protein